MSEAKFTKGEWKLKSTGFHGEFDVTTQGRLDDSKTSILTIDTSYTGYIGIEQQANARLIEAAPKMYEKLDEICHGMFEAGGAGNVRIAREIENLLKEARGE